MVKLLHFSDVHLTAKSLGWKMRDTFGKRVTGYANVRLLGRGYRFKHASMVAAALVEEWKQRKPDHLVFTGDATTLAFDTEMAEAALALHVGQPDMPPAIAVPGNHDLYTFGSVRNQCFETHFASWLEGERADGSQMFPFARKAGHVWLIGLASSRATLMPWDASGRVGDAQLERLKRLVAKLDPGPRIVVTHYPILTRNLKPEPYWRRLRDWRQVRAVAAECGISLWLHGHRHHWYVLPRSDAMPFPSLCAGSSTQTNRWGYHEYTINDWHLSGTRRVYSQSRQMFEDAEKFEVDLARTAAVNA